MSSELKRDCVVIKSCRCPILRGMAVSALIAKPARVCIILFMTGDTFHGRADKERVDMAGLAGDR